MDGWKNWFKGLFCKIWKEEISFSLAGELKGVDESDENEKTARAVLQMDYFWRFSKRRWRFYVKVLCPNFIFYFFLVRVRAAGSGLVQGP